MPKKGDEGIPEVEPEVVEPYEEYEEDVLRLFIAGNSEADIARQIGVDRTSVNRIVKETLQNTAQHRELLNSEALSVYVTRLETLIQAAWGQVEGGDLKAIEVARRLLEQQAKLYGLHEPVRRPGGAIPPLSDQQLAEPDEPEDELASYRSRYKAGGGAP